MVRRYSWSAGAVLRPAAAAAAALAPAASSGRTSTEVVAVTGQTAPGGNGQFAGFSNLALNDAGQVAFEAGLTGTSGGANDNQGLFLFDNASGLLALARTGDPLLGSTITSLSLTDATPRLDDAISSLNEQGQVAYAFVLADGRQGVAIVTIPEPAALGLLAPGGLALRPR
jgi:hypothetical protein